MEIRLHSDLTEFAALTEGLYGADPVTHTVALTLVAQRLGPMGADDVGTLLTVHDGAAVIGAALRTPPHPLVVSALPESAASAAARALLGHDPELNLVGGPCPRPEAFAGAWCAATGASARTVIANRLFRLGELTPPFGVPGRARRADAADQADLELACRWQQAFVREAVPDASVPNRDHVRRQLAGGGATMFWELPDGEPVAMARASEPVSGMSRIGPVYTPPERRGRGYGSAVTAATSRWALDAGVRDVVLFTDLANPISNAIYPRLGYRPVHDAVQLALTLPQ
ncbi:MAG: GNAT family N-acetyltransferase [Pseudonocardia sp.]